MRLSRDHPNPPSERQLLPNRGQHIRGGRLKKGRRLGATACAQRSETPNPHLPDDDFDAAVSIAQAEYGQGKPDVVVGSSRGGVVAMNIDSGDTPMVLLCPAWKAWGTATAVKPNTIILHSQADETMLSANSEELVRNSSLPPEALVEVGIEHRLADEESLAMMLKAVERVK